MHTIRIDHYGGPEVLRYQEYPSPEPGSNTVLVKIGAIGVNFADVYRRTGLAPAKLPFTPGSEASGIIEAVGPHVTTLRVGDRVASASFEGCYAEYALAPAEKVVPIPSNVDDVTAAAVLLQGMTAHYLTQSTYQVQPGDMILVHAAAGGVGLLLTQMVRRRGGQVIGVVSSEEKAQLARQAGANHVIVTTHSDFEQEVGHITNGQGVAAVYDGVGKTTFEKSLNCLKVQGSMVLFGNASGLVPPLDPMVLNAKGSLYLTRPSLAHYTADRASLLSRASEVFQWLAAGEMHVQIGRMYSLKDAGQAHSDLENRTSRGKLLLLPVP